MCRILSVLKNSDYFETLLGNAEFKSKATALLTSSVPPHALLICGADGCGRTLAARLFASAWLEDRFDRVLRSVHPDCVEVRGEGASGLIPVRIVRETISELACGAVMAENGRRCAIIHGAFSLNASSSAALLKSLEEPRDGVLYILTARSPQDVIETVRSRVICLTLLPAGDDACSAVLTERCADLSADDKKAILAAARGRIGIALLLARDARMLELAGHARMLAVRAIKRDKLGAMSSFAKAANREEANALLVLALIRLEAAAEALPEQYEAISRTHDAILAALRDISRNMNLNLVGAAFAASL